MPQFRPPLLLAWILAALGGAVVACGFTSCSVVAPIRLHGFYRPAALVDGRTVNWSRSAATLDFPTLVWRPLKVTLLLHAPREAQGHAVRARIVADGVPAGEVVLQAGWHPYTFTAGGHGPWPRPFSVRIATETEDDHGVGVGQVVVAPTAVALPALLIVAAGSLTAPIFLVGPLRRRVAAPRLVPVAYGALAAAIPVVLILRWHVDVPVGDEWALLQGLKDSVGGSVPWQVLVRSHNGHLMVVPKMILIPLAWATGWNTWYEIALNLAVVSTSAAVLGVAVLRARDLGSPVARLWVVAGIFTLLFSARQVENWVMGFQLAAFLNVLAAIAGLWLLSADQAGQGRILAAWACGVVASYSYGTGIGYWAAAGALLLLAKIDCRRVWVAVWCATAAVVVWTHVVQNVAPGPGRTDLASLANLRALAKYELTYLAAPLVTVPARSPRWIAAWGLITMAITLVLAPARTPPVVRGCRALALYALAAGMVIGVARAGLGTEQALASRYVTFGQLFWIALLVAGAYGSVEAARRKRRAVSWYLRLSVAAVLVLATAASARSLVFFRENHERVEPSRLAFLQGTDPAQWKRVFPYPDYLVAERPFLVKHRLTVFRVQSPSPER